MLLHPLREFEDACVPLGQEDVDIHLRGSSLLLALAAQNGQLEEEQKAWHEQIAAFEVHENAAVGSLFTHSVARNP